MKLFLLALLTSVAISCSQHSQTPSQSNAENQTASNSDTVVKQFLIDVSSSAWFQSEMAQVALKRSHDTAILSLAQTITMQYTRIKDRAKIISVPYKLNMPYFLKTEQNAGVNELNTIDDSSFTKEFLQRINATNETMLKQCNDIQSVSIKDSDVVHFISFIRSIVESTKTQLQKNF